MAENEKQSAKTANDRLVVIPVARDIFSTVSSEPRKNYKKTSLAGCPEESVYVFSMWEDESERSAYNVPYLFKANGEPWLEANDYLMHQLAHRNPVERPTDETRRKAGRLLDYALFCERENLDWLDFSASRRSGRPTYRYFKSMCNDGKRSPAVINQYTGTVYDFYKYVSKFCHRSLDINRVDTVTMATIRYETARGMGAKDVEVRSQTKRKRPRSEIPIGYIREDGEDLRPLSTTQMRLFLDEISKPHWGVQERLIFQFALYTGARKQTVLTLRLKHLRAFSEDKLRRNGTYVLEAGPGTGIDTKNAKSQKLYVPRQLAEDIVVWANSPAAKTRRFKLRTFFEVDFPELKPLDEDDMYVFLSDQGNPYYMAKNDPRYPVVKSPPIGQVTDTLKRKIHRCLMGCDFPKDFSYHWLRATFAYQFYLSLQPLVDEGRMNVSDQLGIVRERLHHESVTTTENYLKLFSTLNERLGAQEEWEDKVFGSY